MTADEARRVTSVAEAQEVLGSGRFTFEEALDAARVARIAEEWELLEQAALTALGAVGRRSLPNRTLLEAAELIAIAHLKWILSLDETGRALRRAVAVLSDLKTKVSGAAQDAIYEELQWLNEVILLVGDQDEASFVSLCARLRRPDRADLGREAATRALSVNPANAQALTTRGAAAVDDFLLDAAAEDLEAAWTLEPTAYVANAMSRLSLAAGRPDDALSWAETAVDLDPALSLGRFLQQLPRPRVGIKY